MRYRYLYYILLLIPAFLFRDYTPTNELKYISIVDEALKNGTWFTFYNHGAVYADKPPLFFWLIMLIKLITGTYNMWLIGLFSLLPTIGIMAVMDRWVRKEGIASNPLVSNVLLLTTGMFLGSALVVRMDMLMTFFIVVSLYIFWTIYKNDEHARIGRSVLPVFIFLALFTKGPIGLLIPVVSIISFLVLKKQIRTIGRYLGWQQWTILAGLCALWFALIYVEGGRDYLYNILFKQTIGRGVNSFHHKEPFWFYVPRMLWSFAPWSLLYVVLLWKGIQQKTINDDLKKFFLIVISTSLILLSAISSKLDIYLLPEYPFIVYLCSIILMDNLNNKFVKIAITIPALLFALILPVIIAFGHEIFAILNSPILLLAACIMLTFGGVVAIILLHKKQTLRAICVISFAIIGLVFIGSFIIPSVNKYIGFREMASSALVLAKKKQVVHYACYKFNTASNMDVYLNSELQQTETVSQLDSMAHHWNKTILFVRKKELLHDEELIKWIGRYSPVGKTDEYSWYLIEQKNSNSLVRLERKNVN